MRKGRELHVSSPYRYLLGQELIMAGKGEAMTILIIEDEAEIRDFALRVLEG